MTLPTPRTWSVGELLTATLMNAQLRDMIDFVLTEKVVYKRKTADETVTASTTHQDDDALFATVAANSFYDVTLRLKFSSSSTADLSFSFNMPTLANFDFFGPGPSSAATSDSTGVRLANFSWTGPGPGSGFTEYGGLGGDAGALIRGMLTTGSSGGTFGLKWAQNSASGSTIMRARSYMRVELME